MNLLPRKIVNVAVIAGGLMSSEIATILVLRNYRVILKEKSEKHLLDEMNRIKGNLTNYVKNGKATQDDLGKAFSRLEGTLDYDNFKEVDLVIEAENEDLSLKQQLFANLENFCNPRCIFSSTSSRFSLKVVGEKTKCQDRIAQVHFSCPSPAMPLMEIIHMKSASPQVIVDLIEFGRKVRKTPILVSDCKGSAVNRMVVAYLHASILLTECGVDVNQIDRALKSFGMQMGPFRLIDMIGFQVVALISKSVAENLPDRPYKTKLMSFLRQNGHDDPELRKHIEKARNVSNVTVNCKLMKLSDGEMAEMILFPVLNEACEILSEDIIIRSSDLDVASVLGMGFPTYRGGIVYWSNSFDSSYIHSRLEQWSVEYGEFFKPCNYILEHSAKKTSLAKETTRPVKSQL